MTPFVKHTGLVAAMDRVNVDTDQIIPKQFLKRTERTGFGQFLFYDWRFLDDGRLNPDFELNQPAFQGASVLVSRANFGCGSSREHAPWALLDYGFRAIIAPSFADIFYNNCSKNGIVAVRLTEAEVEELFQRAAAQKGSQPGYRLTVDLENLAVDDGAGFNAAFAVDAFQRQKLLKGLDDIGYTLEREREISRFEAAASLSTKG
ncbi:MAG TPA: 3-isopropylmalate dehydratase small subunit [Blastocatellia bacterium]|nr:3-isopropylmalate dehydratase small subunit [Blastocatellia bacterium]